MHQSQLQTCEKWSASQISQLGGTQVTGKLKPFVQLRLNISQQRLRISQQRLVSISAIRCWNGVLGIQLATLGRDVSVQQ